MFRIKFIKVFDTQTCFLDDENVCFASGTGDSKFGAFWDLVKECWKYGMMRELFRTRKIIGL